MTGDEWTKDDFSEALQGITGDDKEWTEEEVADIYERTRNNPLYERLFELFWFDFADRYPDSALVKDIIERRKANDPA